MDRKYMRVYVCISFKINIREKLRNVKDVMASINALFMYAFLFSDRQIERKIDMDGWIENYGVYKCNIQW